MATTLLIKVTKEILEKSKNCGRCAINNCAIALAVRDIFPKASVAGTYLHTEVGGVEIPLPWFVSKYIAVFDSTASKERPNLPEIEFEIEIPDSVIEKINIEEILPLLENHPTLELKTETKFTKRDIYKVTQ